MAFTENGYKGGDNETLLQKFFGKTLTLLGSIFEKSGYAQTGWEDESGNIYELNETYDANAPVVLKPVWQIIIPDTVPSPEAPNEWYEPSAPNHGHKNIHVSIDKSQTVDSKVKLSKSLEESIRFSLGKTRDLSIQRIEFNGNLLETSVYSIDCHGENTVISLDFSFFEKIEPGVHTLTVHLENDIAVTISFEIVE